MLLLCLQTDRYAEYPKLKELVERKDGLIAARATPPTFLKVSSVWHIYDFTICQTYDVQFTAYANLHRCAPLGSQQICTLDTPIPYGSLQDTPDHHHCKPNLHSGEVDDYRVSCKLLHDVGVSELHCGSM